MGGVKSGGGGMRSSKGLVTLNRFLCARLSQSDISCHVKIVKSCDNCNHGN